METNFFGPMKLMRLVLPSMRERRSGTIVNISSTAGIEAGASRSMHASSKWGLEAVSESLAEEMKPQGVRVLIVEPGGFRSNFAAAVNMAKADIPKEYQGTMTDQMLTAVTMMTPEMVKLFPGDVEKGCQAILDVVTKSGRAEGDG
jgi:short-subunit dehydrogenase